MKKLLLIFYSLIFILEFSALRAQNNIEFNEAISLKPGFGAVSLSVMQLQNNYLLYGSTVDTIGKQCAGLAKIDSSGKLIWTKLYPFKGYNEGTTGYEGETGIILPGGGEIATDILQNDTTGFYDWALYRFDSEGDTIWTKNYKDSANFYVNQIKLTHNDKYLIYGQWENLKSLRNGFSTLVLVKTDSLGNKIWEKTYNGYGRSRMATGIDTCSDGGFILCAYDYDTISDCSGQILVMKTDSAGKPQWSKYISGSPCDLYGNSITSLKDGGYVVCGFYDDTNNASHGQYNPLLYVAKLSGSGNIIWSKEYGPRFGVVQGLNCLLRPIELANGDIVVCGNALDVIDSLGYYAGCILKIDSNGNKKWLSLYIKDTATLDEHYLTDIKATSDGGYIVTGFILEDTTMIWAVKTDSLGDITGLPFFFEPSTSGLKVYPNPSNGIFNLKMGSEELAINNTVEVYNVLGEKVYSQFNIVNSPLSINLSGQPQGVYFYRVLSESGKLAGEGKFVIQK